MSALYTKIRQLCFANNISIHKLEQTLGFGNGTIKRWDKSIPQADRLAAVATFFNLPIEALTGDSMPEQKEIPAAISNEEYQDAILRGQNSYFLSLFQRLTPAQKDQTIAEILQKLQSQQVQDEQ